MSEPILSRDQILKIVRKTLKENNDRDKLSSDITFVKLVAALEEAWLEKVFGDPVAWQVRRADGKLSAGFPIQWEECTKELYDETLQTGRYAGYENGPRCEVRALYALTWSKP
ncbi:hypothetical protein [Burkholderia ambifaria]|uniref:hypothetical protein n=1 Tax=Burkholderia ambifaria TaxID=152480 RepID=UPI00201128B4|nr:hypothetical protein [Burkholderia ambifaria]